MPAHPQRAVKLLLSTIVFLQDTSKTSFTEAVHRWHRVSDQKPALLAFPAYERDSGINVTTIITFLRAVIVG